MYNMVEVVVVVVAAVWECLIRSLLLETDARQERLLSYTPACTRTHTHTHLNKRAWQ